MIRLDSFVVSDTSEHYWILSGYHLWASLSSHSLDLGRCFFMPSGCLKLIFSTSGIYRPYLAFCSEGSSAFLDSFLGQSCQLLLPLDPAWFTSSSWENFHFPCFNKVWALGLSNCNLLKWLTTADVNFVGILRHAQSFTGPQGFLIAETHF